VGQTVGWVEGFKALTDLYSVADGTFFAGGNPEIEADPTRIDKDPYGQGGSISFAARRSPKACRSKGISNCWTRRSIRCNPRGEPCVHPAPRSECHTRNATPGEFLASDDQSSIPVETYTFTVLFEPDEDGFIVASIPRSRAASLRAVA